MDKSFTASLLACSSSRTNTNKLRFLNPYPRLLATIAILKFATLVRGLGVSVGRVERTLALNPRLLSTMAGSDEPPAKKKRASTDDKGTKKATKKKAPKHQVITEQTPLPKLWADEERIKSHGMHFN